MAMSAPTYAITGIQVGLGPAPGQVPLRQEVDAWFTNSDNRMQVSLFLLALKYFQAMDPGGPEGKLSYFEIAGIHGLPLKPWDEDTESQTPGMLLGYCTHGSILFPNWHRSYILLFEQRLYEIMTAIVIPDYPKDQQDGLLAAANTWRLPYWDWAAKKHRHGAEPTYCAPLIVLPEKIDVIGPTGTVEISNPMYKYTAPVKMGEYDIVPVPGDWPYNAGPPVPFDECKATSRYPPSTSGDSWVDGVEHNDKVDASLATVQWYEGKKYKDTLGEAVYRLFSENYFSTYDAFASTRLAFPPKPQLRPTPPDYLSLEDIHNNIHNWTGGNYGHMAWVSVAAFDPIFWLHHANIDRQYAIWQSLNPRAWFDSPDQQHSDPFGNWSTPAGAISKPDTPLAPFHTDTKGTYFTSQTCRDWTKYGYTYPELQPWHSQYHVDGQFDEQRYLDDIKAQVNFLYRSKSLVNSPYAHIRPDGDIEHHDYIVNLSYARFALGGIPFTIHIFIGENMKVGSVYNFSTPVFTTGGPGGCENCRRQEESGALSKSQAHITHSLLREIEDRTKGLWSLEPREVEAYLRERLLWKVTGPNGNDIPLESIPSLEISLAVGTATHHRHYARLPRFHSYRVLHSVTQGRPGGLSQADL